LAGERNFQSARFAERTSIAYLYRKATPAAIGSRLEGAARRAAKKS
jgi:hypothetical protein